MLRLAIDEDVDHRIVRGLERRLTALDVETVQGAGLTGVPDDAVLGWATGADRVLLTCDRNTMVAHALNLADQGQPMSGVLVVNRQASLRSVIDDLELVVTAMAVADLQGKVWYIPL